MSDREKRLWRRTVRRIVESNRDFLIYIASEKR
jgi:hypothetical protein